MCFCADSGARFNSPGVAAMRVTQAQTWQYPCAQCIIMRCASCNFYLSFPLSLSLSGKSPVHGFVFHFTLGLSLSFSLKRHCSSKVPPVVEIVATSSSDLWTAICLYSGISESPGPLVRYRCWPVESLRAWEMPKSQ